MPRRKADRPVVSEADIQRTIVEGLRLHGYTVLVTNPSRVFLSCPKCGSRVDPRFRGDKGVPDLLVTHRMAAPGLWLGLEVKRPGGVASNAEQKELIDAMAVVVVTSFDEAFAAAQGAFL
jgi:hypothetical protein